MGEVNLEEAAQEMWELYGSGAHRICSQSAKLAEERGESKLAQQWREIAQACETAKTKPKKPSFQPSLPGLDLDT